MRRAIVSITAAAALLLTACGPEAIEAKVSNPYENHVGGGPDPWTVEGGGSGLPTCPTDGSVYPFGSCEPPPGVDRPSFRVEPGAPSKVCDYAGTLFECPASYVVPGT